MSENPLVKLPQLCPRHLEACAAEDRRRGGTALVFILTQLALFNHATSSDEVMIACGGDPTTGKLADADRLGWALAERAPLCCWLGDDKFGALLLEVLSDSRLKKP